MMIRPVKHIAISFTLSEHELADIRPKLEEIKKSYVDENYDVRLIHGFMPKELVEAKGFSTDLVDMLNAIFPDQLNFFGRRDVMALTATNLKAEIYMIGNIAGGVIEEFNLYRSIPNQSITIIPIKQKQ